MREDKIYKDNSITKDKIADLLGTNRTYLSRITNDKSKAISADLGFNSISTFYNLFQSAVGMTPSQYRNKVLELQKQQ